MKRWRNRILLIAGAALIVAAVVWMLLPKPVSVELSTVTRGPMEVTVNHDGQTRVKQPYVVSAPLAGELQRIDLLEGDAVVAGKTVLATITPRDPELLDVRAVAEARARVDSAKAGLTQAASQVDRAKAELQLAQLDLKRIRRLHENRAATNKELDDAILLEQVRQKAYDAAKSARQVAGFQVALAQAALLRVAPTKTQPAETDRDLIIRSPVTGKVFRVLQKSAAAVTPGQRLVEVGNPSDLEIKIDVLSRDAVKVHPGDRVHIENWGGPKPLRGVVRVVEPSGFTKVSALGVEEQRVNVIIDILSPHSQWRTLGDAFRVDARIVVWSGGNILQVPSSALFRKNGAWAVFVDRGGRAAIRKVRIGKQSATRAQVLGGLKAGDQVITYPSDQIQDGTAIVRR